MTTERHRPLEVGVLLPVFEGDMGGQTARWTDLVAMATLAEAVGFDSVWVVDHLLSERAEWEDRQRQGPWECWSILSALAASTKRVKLGPLVTSTGFRNPALLAKMADTVDEISNGRLILGLGAGWHEPEFRAFGLPFDHQVSRFEEALIIVSSLLRHGHVDFEGEYFAARDCELRPRGPRPNGMPIMVGTNSMGPRMSRLIATHADSWNVWTVWTENRPHEIPAFQSKINTACAEIGRDPISLAGTVAIQVNMPGHEEQEGSLVNPITGTPEQVAATLREYARLGISHMQVLLQPSTPAAIEEFGAVLSLLDQDSQT